MNRRSNISRDMWVVIGVVAVSLLVVAGLVRGIWEQMELLHRVRTAEAELAPLVSYAKQRNENLRTELEYVSSGQYVEEWARVYGGMSAPGEVLLVLSLPENGDGEPSPPVATVVEGDLTPMWIRLWRWMSGES